MRNNFNFFSLETKINQIDDSASMIPTNITFKNFGEPFSKVKYRKTPCVKACVELS